MAEGNPPVTPPEPTVVTGTVRRIVVNHADCIDGEWDLYRDVEFHDVKGDDRVSLNRILRYLVGKRVTVTIRERRE